ncbi:MAG: hypothetical protein ACLFQ6_08090 [Candidatus Sumerlaeia bacterium]
MRNIFFKYILVSLALTIFSFFGQTLQGQESPSEAPWWNDAWSLRYKVEFRNVGASEGAEIAMVSFRPEMEERKNPYDVRAVDAEGNLWPVKVLYWTPGGKATFLIGFDPSIKDSAKWQIYLYFGNPDAKPEYYAYPWKNPTLLIGSQLKRSFLRHGEWRWMPDARFDAVHLGIAADEAERRVTHAVTDIEAISIHPSRTRMVQMLWIDPAFPATAVSVDLMFDRDIVSAYWTNSEELPKNTIASGRAIRMGNLPEPGKWAMLEIPSSDLELRSNSLLDGIGFSTHGGNVKWGPTALGAMPVTGELLLKEKRLPHENGAFTVLASSPDEALQEFFPPDVLQLNILHAPLLGRASRPLALTWFLEPHHKYLGDLPDCQMEIAAELLNGESKFLDSLTVEFVGGDNWQRTVEIPAVHWQNAESIHGRILGKDGQALAEAVLRLEPLGPVKGIKANGNILSNGSTVMSFLPITAQGRTTAPDAGDVLYFRASLADAPHGVVPVNSDDPRLGLSERVSPYTRRTAAEWLVAASRAAGNDTFTEARIVIDSRFLDIGVSLRDTSAFLAGLIRILQTAEGMRVTMDLEPLRQNIQSARDQALLAACSEARSLLE